LFRYSLNNIFAENQLKITVLALLPESYRELFSTAKGAVYQCDRANKLILSFWDSLTPMSVRDFQLFRRMIQTIDVQQMALSTADADDVEIVTMPQFDRCYVLTLCDVVHLRELLNGTFAMIELNSMLRECGCSLADY